MTRPSTLPAPWSYLVAKLGSVQALASALGAAPRTLHGWASGARTPRGPSLALIRLVFKKHKIESPF